MKRFSYLLTALLALSVVGYCAKAPKSDDPPIVNSKSPISVTASPGKESHKAGEPVELFISVQNNATWPVTLEFNSGQSFDFQAFEPGGTEPLWTWSMDKMFTQALREVELEGGKSLDFTAQWENAPKGRYEIRGFITANGAIRALPFEISVE